MKLFSKSTDAENPPMAATEQAEKDATPAQIESGPAPTAVDAEMERRVRRKLDMNLIPLVSALYLRTYNHSAQIDTHKVHH